jgi:hypothetical protein
VLFKEIQETEQTFIQKAIACRMILKVNCELMLDILWNIFRTGVADMPAEKRKYSMLKPCRDQAFPIELAGKQSFNPTARVSVHSGSRTTEKELCLGGINGSLLNTGK